MTPLEQAQQQQKKGCDHVLIELNPEYIGIIKKRLASVQMKL